MAGEQVASAAALSEIASLLVAGLTEPALTKWVRTGIPSTEEPISLCWQSAPKVDSSDSALIQAL
jgi:hypothetical protein